MCYYHCVTIESPQKFFGSLAWKLLTGLMMYWIHTVDHAGAASCLAIFIFCAHDAMPSVYNKQMKFIILFLSDGFKEREELGFLCVGVARDK